MQTDAEGLTAYRYIGIRITGSFSFPFSLFFPPSSFSFSFPFSLFLFPFFLSLFLSLPSSPFFLYFTYNPQFSTYDFQSINIDLFVYSFFYSRILTKQFKKRNSFKTELHLSYTLTPHPPLQKPFFLRRSYTALVYLLNRRKKTLSSKKFFYTLTKQKKKQKKNKRKLQTKTKTKTKTKEKNKSRITSFLLPAPFTSPSPCPF